MHLLTLLLVMNSYAFFALPYPCHDRPARFTPPFAGIKSTLTSHPQSLSVIQPCSTHLQDLQHWTNVLLNSSTSTPTYSTVTTPTFQPPKPQCSNGSSIWAIPGAFLAYTIKAYLGHVKSLHVNSDLPFHAIKSPVVQRVIRGIKRYFGDRDRKPTTHITFSTLQRLVTVSAPRSSLQDANLDAA